MSRGLPDDFFRKLSTKEQTSFKEWAVDNYEPGTEVNPLWHPVVRSECERINKRNDQGSDGGNSIEGGPMEATSDEEVCE